MIGDAGQRRLGRSRAVIVGCGALGCVAADLLTRAGVGTLVLIDRDVVEPTNLHRQTLFTEADARDRLPKAEAARQRLSAVNSDITIHAHIADFVPSNAERLTGLLDTPASLDESPAVLIDATDNFPTRLLLNDLAVKHGLPMVYAGAVAMEGALATILPQHPARDWAGGRATACLRCLVPELPEPGSLPTCDTAGVLGATTSVIASLQAAEAIKCLLGRWDAAASSLRKLDLWTNQSTATQFDRDAIDPACPCCSQRRFAYLDGQHANTGATLCGRNAVQIQPAQPANLDLQAIAEQWQKLAAVQATAFMVRATLPGADETAAMEMTLFADGRAIIEGTTDAERAAAIYAQLVGH